MYTYSGPSFRADDSEFSSCDSEVNENISDPSKLIFYILSITKNNLLVSIASKRKLYLSSF